MTDQPGRRRRCSSRLEAAKDEVGASLPVKLSFALPADTDEDDSDSRRWMVMVMAMKEVLVSRRVPTSVAAKVWADFWSWQAMMALLPFRSARREEWA